MSNSTLAPAVSTLAVFVYFLGECAKCAKAFRALGLSYDARVNAWEIPTDKIRAATITFQEAYRYDPRVQADRPAAHSLPSKPAYRTFEEQKEDARMLRLEARAKAAGMGLYKFMHGQCEDAPCCGCCGGLDHGAENQFYGGEW